MKFPLRSVWVRSLAALGLTRLPAGAGRGAARFLAGTTLITGCLALAGCATPSATRPGGDSAAAQVPGSWQPQQLYLLGSPHGRLYVEVDAVEGCEPSEAVLNGLRDFLTTYCRKPEGIQIVRSDVIPAQSALGISPTALARKYLNGPPADSASPAPAFIYVLYFNDLLSDRPSVVETGHLGAQKAPRSRLSNRNPHVEMLPYPAMIYMNARMGPKSTRALLLDHEAGHVLGLAFRPDNASGGHCRDQNCLMYKTVVIHLKRLLLGRDPILQRQLCDRCAAQLTDGSRQAPAANVRFIGPVLVRSERDYHVLSLPHRLKVIAGSLTDEDCRDFAAAVRAETPSRGDDDNNQRADGQAKDEVLRDPARLCAILDKIKADPWDPVRALAAKWWARVSIERCLAGRQFTNAVDLCRQAILADPKDDWSYNQLAWIKATCPDAAVRDAREAVAAAGKACALTRWTQWSWVDTLAAAYAEAGDFKRALKFEEQASRIGPLGESDLTGIRERTALYQQSQPFRSKP